jgi:polysaccharide deacetylase family protein (PEP-CTERM system associated)
MDCIFSVDVEDWFHILDSPAAPDMSAWDSLPSRVEANFFKLLDIFEEKGVSTTCFFLGWVARRRPLMVKEASARGHEIASHGYSHTLAYTMNPGEFLRDAKDSKDTLEDILGHEIEGFRAAGFSVTDRTPWFFDKLLEAGYHYDSSVFPATRGHGGLKSQLFAPFRVSVDSRSLVEFPVSVRKVLGQPVCFFGGGYLRFFPYSIIERSALKVLNEGRPVNFYVHPREIDLHHPRLRMSLPRMFMCYMNLGTTEAKIRRLLSRFKFTTFADYARLHRDKLELRCIRSLVPWKDEMPESHAR